jgi:CysZ protein
MPSDLLRGVGYFFSGIQLIFRPKLRLFVILPLLINILLFSLAIYGGWLGLQQGMTAIQHWLPEAWAWLHWLLYPLFILLAVLIFIFGFSSLINFIGAPFNGLLAEQVEMQLTGQAMPSIALKNTPKILCAEVQKIGYSLRYLIPLGIISLIPIINFISPFLWLLWGAWLMSLQYLAYPFENHGILAPAQRAYLAQRRGLSLGFGGGVLLVSLLPIVNFLAMPAAVAGATLMFVREFKDKP